MAQKRECRLSDSSQREIDLRLFDDEIIQIIEETVPGKNPMVYKDNFTTDRLTRGEAIRLGHALAKNPGLSNLGKTVHTFRLFDGRNVEVKEGEQNIGPIKKTIHHRSRDSEGVPSNQQEADPEAGSEISACENDREQNVCQ